MKCYYTPFASEQQLMKHGMTGQFDFVTYPNTQRMMLLNGTLHLEFFFAMAVGNGGAGYSGIVVLGREITFGSLRTFKEEY